MRYAFANCILDTDTHSLLRDGVPQKVEPQVFDILRLLMENAGKLVSQDHLVAEIWNGRVVSDSAISARIAAARKAVGDTGKQQAIIRTVARRGIQFVADLSKSGEKPLGSPDSADGDEHLTIRYARTKDGANLAFHVSGSGPALIRAMHYPTHLEMLWKDPIVREAVTQLAKHFTVIQYDARGCGLSDRELADQSNKQAADDLVAVADAAGLERFAVMGMSSGAQIAVQAAVANPKRVTHLVLQAGYVDGRDLRGTSPDPLLSLVRQGWDQNNQAFTKAYLSMYFPDAPQDWVHTTAPVVQAATSKETAALVRDYYNKTSIADVLPRVAAPTLILHSRDDAVHPVSEARKAAAGIAGSELVVLASANHYLMPHEADWDFHINRIVDFISNS